MLRGLQLRAGLGLNRPLNQRPFDDVRLADARSGPGTDAHLHGTEDPVQSVAARAAQAATIPSGVRWSDHDYRGGEML